MQKLVSGFSFFFYPIFVDDDDDTMDGAKVALIESLLIIIFLANFFL